MFSIVPYLRHTHQTQDRFLLRESEDRRTRIFGTLFGKLSYTLIGRTGYHKLWYYLHNPDIGKRIPNLLHSARCTAEEYAGFYKSEYEAFIQAQISVLGQESLRGLWSQLVGGPIRTPPKLVAVLMACRGEIAGYRYKQYQSDRYPENISQPTDEETNTHNAELLRHLAFRWNLPTTLILLQTYRSGIFTSTWIQQHTEFQQLVSQGLAEPRFINDYQKTKEPSPLCPPKSRKKSHLSAKQNSPSQPNSKDVY